MRRLLVLSLLSVVAAALVLGRPTEAQACGCFAVPNPATPVIQAGERIAFAVENGHVVAHIQVQYSGPAAEFGWLLPMPGVPEVGVGTDELFANLVATTQPRYALTSEFEGNCEWRGSTSSGCGAEDASNVIVAPGSGLLDAGASGGGGVAVVQDSVGPYDYAVLRADSKQAMLQWLTDNSYFVPATSSAAIDAYIRPGAYFLALKLRTGESAGDLQPVVLKYPGDLPTIPIVLTSVGAAIDMPILVWVLGESRAVPLNYFHVVLNDARIDWLASAQNYLEVVTEAVDEVEGHHSFITEFAGSTATMVDRLDRSGRFGDRGELASLASPIDYLAYLRANGFSLPGQFGAPVYSSHIISILKRHIPMPGVLEDTLSASEYYTRSEYYLGEFRADNPDLFEGLDFDFDPAVLTDELYERVVTPTLEAGALFRTHSTMTRLFTTLSPEEMTKDPVFAFNPDLPDVANLHSGTMTYQCGDGASVANETPTTIDTAQGHTIGLPNGTAGRVQVTDQPGSLRIEILRQEGPPEVLVDNTDAIRGTLEPGVRAAEGSGCGVGGRGAPLWLFSAAGILLVVCRRRSRSRP